MFDKIVLLDLTVRFILIMLDQLRQIAIFAKTIDHGSFRGAARELQLSPSVVSHHISQLEEHLGVVLVYRSTRKLALTREGERLLASTLPLLDAVENVVSELSSTASTPSGELRLTIPAVLIQSKFSELLAEFSMKYPAIKLTLDYSDERKDLIAGGHDIAIRMGIQAKSSAQTRILFQVERRLIASTQYLKSRPKVTRPEQLEQWDWLELSPVRHIKPTFSNAKKATVSLKPAAHIAANDALALYNMAKAGAGLAIVPGFFATDDIQRGVVQEVLPRWHLAPINVYAAWPANAPKNGLIKLLVNELSGNTTPGSEW